MLHLQHKHPLQTKTLKKTTDAQHLILGVIEKDAISSWAAPTLKSSQLVTAPVAPVRYRLVFTSLLCQPSRTRKSSLLYFYRGPGSERGSVAWKSRGGTGQRHMSLARIVQTTIKAFQSATRQRSGWDGAKSVLGTRLWRGRRVSWSEAA